MEITAQMLSTDCHVSIKQEPRERNLRADALANGDTTGFDPAKRWDPLSELCDTIVLEDPFDDPPGLEVPDASPEPSEVVRRQDRERLADGEDPEAADGRTAEEIEEETEAREAASRAQVLEMLGGLPDADLPPPLLRTLTLHL